MFSVSALHRPPMDLPQKETHERRTDRSLEPLLSPHSTDPLLPITLLSLLDRQRDGGGEKECSSGGVTRRSGPVG